MMRFALLALLALASVSTAKVFFQETFDADWETRWVQSDSKVTEGTAGDFKLASSEWSDDEGIKTSQDARFYALSAKMTEAIDNAEGDLVVQFQVAHPQTLDCGGGYIKLAGDIDQKKFDGETQYAVMFGPDICGSSTKRVHAILRNLDSDKNLLINKEVRCETDRVAHVYTLVLKSTEAFEIYIDGALKESGNIKDAWDFELPQSINDPSDVKPADWVDEAKIVDPEAVKPADWVEAKTIADPEAVEPEDWDEEDDGEFEAPTIANPEYRGEWSAPLIDNAAYKGPWVQKTMANPDFVEVSNTHARGPISTVGFELWQVKAGSIFDNIIVTDSLAEAQAFAAKTFDADAEKKAFDNVVADKKAQAEAARQADEADEDDDDEDWEHDEL